MTEGASNYVFAGDFVHERDRLALGERLWDPGTMQALSAAGIRPGWRCLEVGAGLGSIAAWLAGQVGAHGAVIAVDLRVDRLAWLRERGVEVRQLDVTRDPLPDGEFDLIHARLVLQHLPARRAVLRRLADALRSGGVLLVEDTEVTSLFAHPTESEFLASVKRVAYAVMADAGYDARCGLLNVDLMRAAGLVRVGAEGRAVIVQGGSDQARWYALWLEHLRARMVATGDVTDGEIDRALAELADRSNTWLSQVMVAATGRRGGYEALDGSGVSRAPGRLYDR